MIGYLGRTGYSRTENTNNIDEPHLHFGLQLIFDESQKEGNNEIWIDCYQLVQFLQLNRSETKRTRKQKNISEFLKCEIQQCPDRITAPFSVVLAARTAYQPHDQCHNADHRQQRNEQRQNAAYDCKHQCEK